MGTAFIGTPPLELIDQYYVEFLASALLQLSAIDKTF